MYGLEILERTQHSTSSIIGGRNKRTCNILMKGQVRDATNTVTLLDFLVKLRDVCGKQYGKVLLKDVQVNPKFNYNLISITKLLKDGFHLTRDSNTLYVVQYEDKKELVFNVKINMDTSFLLGAYLCHLNAGSKISATLQKTQNDLI